MKKAPHGADEVAGRFTFRPLAMADLPMLHDWLSRPHRTEWWGPAETLAEVQAEYGAWIADPTKVQPRIVLLGGKPFGYIQSYVAMGSGGGWWEGETAPDPRNARAIRCCATDTLLQAVNFYARFYTGLYAHVAQEQGCFAHDVLAFIYLVQPELFTLEHGAIRVATEGLAQGQTVMNRRDFIRYAQAGWEPDKPLTQVCMQVDAAKSIQLFSDTLMSAWLG